MRVMGSKATLRNAIRGNSEVILHYGESRRPRFDPRSGRMGYVVEQNFKADFRRVLRFPLPILIYRLLRI
jgi:hypothetical protein